MQYNKIPFDEEEMKSDLVYRSMIPGEPDILRPRYPVSVLENLERTRAGEPVWLPSDTEFFMFAPATIVENIARGMVIDTKRIDRAQLGGKDFFGVEWVYMPESRGSMVKPGSPLLEEAGEWHDKVIFPDISQWDWEDCAERNKALLSQDRPIKMTIYTGFFERLVSFMDMEGALIALIDEDQQEDVKELFDRLADFYIELIRYMKKYFNFDLLWFHDDWGSQRAPMFSYDTVEEMIVPYLKKVVSAAHELGIIFEFHSCGNVEQLVPCMIEAGADLWDGQGMNDKVMLSQKYKGQIVVEVEALLEENVSEQEIREYIRDLLDKYDPGIFLGKTFKSDPKITPIAYEMSRRKYSE